jgi:hypothetical protein
MLWPRNESKNHCSISLLNGRETDKTGNDEPESGIESPLLDVDMSKANDREEQTQTEMAEIIRGLFMTNKNVMKCNDCIKTKHVMFLSEGTSNFKNSHTQSNPTAVSQTKSHAFNKEWYQVLFKVVSKVFLILKKLQENLQKCTCNSIILYINKITGPLEMTI